MNIFNAVSDAFSFEPSPFAWKIAYKICLANIKDAGHFLLTNCQELGMGFHLILSHMFQHLVIVGLLELLEFT